MLTRLVENQDFIVAHEFDEVTYRSEKITFAVGIIAGVIPLGIALQQTGAAALLGNAVASTAAFLPAIGVL